MAIQIRHPLLRSRSSLALTWASLPRNKSTALKLKYTSNTELTNMMNPAST